MIQAIELDRQANSLAAYLAETEQGRHHIAAYLSAQQEYADRANRAEQDPADTNTEIASTLENALSATRYGYTAAARELNRTHRAVYEARIALGRAEAGYASDTEIRDAANKARDALNRAVDALAIPEGE